MACLWSLNSEEAEPPYLVGSTAYAAIGLPIRQSNYAPDSITC